MPPRHPRSSQRPSRRCALAAALLSTACGRFGYPTFGSDLPADGGPAADAGAASDGGAPGPGDGGGPDAGQGGLDAGPGRDGGATGGPCEPADAALLLEGPGDLLLVDAASAGGTLFLLVAAGGSLDLVEVDAAGRAVGAPDRLSDDPLDLVSARLAVVDTDRVVVVHQNHAVAGAWHVYAQLYERTVEDGEPRWSRASTRERLSDPGYENIGPAVTEEGGAPLGVAYRQGVGVRFARTDGDGLRLGTTTVLPDAFPLPFVLAVARAPFGFAALVGRWDGFELERFSEAGAHLGPGFRLSAAPVAFAWNAASGALELAYLEDEPTRLRFGAVDTAGQVVWSLGAIEDLEGAVHRVAFAAQADAAAAAWLLVDEDAMLAVRLAALDRERTPGVVETLRESPTLDPRSLALRATAGGWTVAWIEVSGGATSQLRATVRCR